MKCHSWAIVVSFYNEDEAVGLRAGGQAWCLQRKHLPTLSDQH
jgi:hypothetical protein